MTKSIDDLNHINGIGCHTVWLNIGCRPNQTTTQWLHHLESMFEGLQVCSVDVGTLRGTSGEIVEMLKQGSVDNCCLQEVWFKGRSVRMIGGKEVEHKLFWIGNEKELEGVGIFLPKTICK